MIASISGGEKRISFWDFKYAKKPPMYVTLGGIGVLKVPPPVKMTTE
jgi:hypothetical protein